MKSENLKILWITNIPSPYRVDFFNELGKSCELTVLFEKKSSSERNKSWQIKKYTDFNGINLSGWSIDVDKAICFNVFKFLSKKRFDFIFISNALTPTGVLAIEYMKLLKIPYIIEGDGGFKKRGKGIKEIIKRHLIKGASVYFSTAKTLDEYFLKYGANKQNIYRYPFTSLIKDDIIIKTIDKNDKQRIKDKLGISDKKVILSVGQFIHRKGYDILLNACKNLSSDVGIYIIGGTPTVKYLNLKIELKLDNVHFVEFKTKKMLKEYYKMADVFVLPTREDIWGLVINEAMAYGLPIVTTDKCGAGLELVCDNNNGYIVKIGDQKKLVEKLNLIINNDKLREKMAINSLKKIRNYTIENMANRHIEILNCLKQ